MFQGRVFKCLIRICILPIYYYISTYISFLMSINRWTPKYSYVSSNILLTKPIIRKNIKMSTSYYFMSRRREYSSSNKYPKIRVLASSFITKYPNQFCLSVQNFNCFQFHFQEYMLCVPQTLSYLVKSRKYRNKR